MGADGFEFMNRVGVEMWELLLARSDKELEGLNLNERLSAQLSAALIPLASALRGPLMAALPANRAKACQQMVELTMKRLQNLLDQIPGVADGAGA